MTRVNARSLPSRLFSAVYIFVMSPQMLLFNVTPIGLIMDAYHQPDRNNGGFGSGQRLVQDAHELD
jgi:hypothetical protein